MSNRHPIVLASKSPRRLELLRAIGLEPLTLPAALDESALSGEAPRDTALRLGTDKALAVAPLAAAEALVIGADTVVEVAGEQLGKPRDLADARRMLRKLSGRAHQVHTGVALAARGMLARAVVSTGVTFAPLAEAEIEWYVATGEPEDKAGAYAVQGKAGLFVLEIRGSYSNVVGLPVETVYRLAGELGVDLKAAGRDGG